MYKKKPPKKEVSKVAFLLSCNLQTNYKAGILNTCPG
jgi:hypothetical protein